MMSKKGVPVKGPRNSRLDLLQSVETARTTVKDCRWELEAEAVFLRSDLLWNHFHYCQCLVFGWDQCHCCQNSVLGGNLGRNLG